jgi:hypothetical protein
MKNIQPGIADKLFDNVNSLDIVTINDLTSNHLII